MRNIVSRIPALLAGGLIPYLVGFYCSQEVYGRLFMVGVPVGLGILVGYARKQSLVDGLVSFLVSLVIVGLFAGNNYRGRQQAHLAACQRNLQRLAEGLNTSRLPASLPAAPVCPASGLAYGYQHSEQTYTIFCSGLHHREAWKRVETPDYPRISPGAGLELEPKPTR